VDIAVELNDTRREGTRRNNIAADLIKLHRHSKARRELKRAIECDKEYGHVAEPWKLWNNLHDLEPAENNPNAARDAKAKAVTAYLAYRRDGGENHEFDGKLCAAAESAIQQNKPNALGELTHHLHELAQHED